MIIVGPIFTGFGTNQMADNCLCATGEKDSSALFRRGGMVKSIKYANRTSRVAECQ